MSDTVKSLGQYFTTSDDLQDFVIKHVRHKGARLLEPSFGVGHLVSKFLEEDQNYPMVCCELDTSLVPVVSFGPAQTVIYGDFLQQDFETPFQTIIGNPPYVRRGNTNLYLEFIRRCVDLLTDDGELIFIVPSDFLKLTRATPLLTHMLDQGSFTDFLFPHNERLFANASIDVVVFRYQKGIRTSQVTVNGAPKVCAVSSGIVTFCDSHQSGTPLHELFDVYVGLVSARDSVFKSALGRHRILCDKDVVESFILERTFPTPHPTINQHLLDHKQELLDRKIRKFNESNWFEWGAPRNQTVMDTHAGKPCIYVRAVTRREEVAWKGTVQYFGGSLLCMIPRKETVDLDLVVGLLNSPDTKRNYTYSGRFKIGHKQLCNVFV